MKVKAWISAFRLRTLPLALSSIGMGSFLALSEGNFQIAIFVWASLTTIFLQVLSNLANDLGDTIHGADSEQRVGPTRAVQSGAISISEIRIGIIVFIGLSIISGITLLAIAVGLFSSLFFVFLLFGILSIAAAYAYTAGKRPYGYAGLGDIMVMIFFGILGVGGSYFLFSLQADQEILLPALALGALATGVLNINNIRDIDSDTTAGKNTIPVRFGLQVAVIYHWVLISVAIVFTALYIALQEFSYYHLIWLLGIPLLLFNGYKVTTTWKSEDLDPLLKQLALSTFFFMITFGLAIVLG